MARGASSKKKVKRSVCKDATNQISNWAMEGMGNDEKVNRSCGILPDNVTEERLLRTRLWELGKERHKFISAVDYEKKMFLEKQQRRWPAMRGRLMPSSTRSAPLRRSGKCASVVTRPRTTPARHKDEYKGEPIFSTEPPEIQIRTTKKVQLPVGDKLPEISIKTSTMTRPTPTPRSMRESLTAPILKNTGQYQSNPLNDRRYIHLERSLSDLYVGMATEIPKIIDSKDCLHTKARIVQSTRPNMGNKIRKFMREKGLIF
ncbi:hypothetical protein CAPTEDRAFT_204562 [Capitella teleta]|uniref:Uncharacterized protein n=1 Tax=Capitella teleta TaxID=283909 RepID=R7U2X1_CAPTE|nr:hypothetical protein CAPTEDRAFT_204562 [Capitella teleta]|eukprot:ELT98016.1 hypothetical protein CAPTEDRAFT_204562 [Capitella teleta]